MSVWNGLHVVDDENSDNPLVKGSDVDVWTLINEYDGGASSEQIAHKFRLPKGDVQRVLSFAHRYLPETDPIDWSHCEAVELVPGRCGGAPVIRGTRMPVLLAIENFDDGVTAEEFAEDFDIDIADVRKAFAFFEELRRLPLAS